MNSLNKVPCLVITANEPTSNGRIYSEDMLRKMCNEINSSSDKMVMSYQQNYENVTPSLQSCIGIVSKCYYEDSRLYFDIEPTSPNLNHSKISYEIIPVVCGKCSGNSVSVDKIPFVMMRPIDSTNVSEYCHECSLFRLYASDGSLLSCVRHPNNCVHWLCNDDGCPYDKEIADMMKAT